MNLQIQTQLEEVAKRQRSIERWSGFAMCWSGAALAGFAILVLERQVGWTSSLILPLILVGALVAAVVFDVRHSRRRPDWSQIATRIEARHPELEGRLVTLLQQDAGPNGELNYLQQRLLKETLDYGQRTAWRETIPHSFLRLAQAGHWVALGLFAFTLFELRGTRGPHLFSRTEAADITVTPGDVNLERGSSLVVLARFKGGLPAKVELAFGQPPSLQRVSLVKSLGDPMFGGSISEVSSNFVYHVEYGGQRTRDFNVIVYEHPRLERSDADLTFPSYTALPKKRIENTRRVSAVEGSRIDLALEFNKPVTSARLISRDKERTAVSLAIDAGQPKASLKQLRLDASKTYDLQLVDSDGRTNKVPAEFVFEALKNRPPEMRLTSPRGDLRPSPLEEISFEGTIWDDFGVKAFGLAYAVNGQTTEFVELGESVPGNEKKAFHHVLRLEQLGVRPDQLVSWFVWADDLGPDGEVRRTMGDLYFGEIRPFEEVFREGQAMQGQGGGGESGGEDQTGKLADLQKQIVNATWKLEREHGTPGGIRGKPSEGTPSIRRAREPSGDSSRNSPLQERYDRTGRTSIGPVRVMGQLAQTSGANSETSDLFSSSPSHRASPSQGKGSFPKYEDDASVVLDSQRQALEQARDSLERQRDPQSAGLWQKAVNQMEQALARLETATNSPAALKDALAAEQAAYQALIQLQAHEYQVSRSRNQGQSGSSRNQQMQRQLEEMDLTDTENRYENQREAQRTQNPERREQLQIMSRLQELARRQQDLNQRLKELQAALQEARTEQERAEVRRQLKRLQEEEQQMLADVDELRQRMDRPENQSRLADERRQLDQTREEVQKASEAASQGSASQALAAGTRVENQLQQLREDLRKKNSSQFADDLRQMRSQARELARQQEDILKKIKEGSSTEQKSLSAGADQEQTRARLAKQKDLMTNLLERATQVSQQAEEAEPLLSHQLYDTVRKFTQDTAKDLKESENELLNRGPMTRSLFELLRDNSQQGGAKLEDITSEMVRLGYLPQAGRVGEKARSGIEQLKKGVERAAESVLGDDAEDLRLAQKELDDLTRQLQQEIADGKGNGLQTNLAAGGNDRPSEQGKSGARQQTPTQLAQAQGPGQPNPGQPGSNEGQSQADNQQEAQSGGPSKSSSSQTAQASGASQQPGKAGEKDSAAPNQGGEGSTPSSLASQNAQGQPGNPNPSGQQAAGPASGGGGDPRGGALAAAAGGGARNWNWDRLLDESIRRQNAPITGEDFPAWSDRLREVEQLLDEADLRDDVAKARESARLLRQDFKRERKKPDWAVVQLQVMKPLTEVRDRIADELARRESREALVPLDRDPVPNRYSDLVRRYYEELGKEK